MLLEESFDPGLLPVLTMERPFVDDPCVNTFSVLSNDFEVTPHDLHNFAVVIDPVSAVVLIDIDPWRSTGARHGEPNKGVFTCNERKNPLHSGHFEKVFFECDSNVSHSFRFIEFDTHVTIRITANLD